MILADRDILKAIETSDLEVFPLNRDFIQPSSIDLTLSSIIRVFDERRTELIDIKRCTDPSQPIDVGQEGSFIVHPHDFILGSTCEKIALSSSLAAKIEGRSSLGRLGLTIQASASYIAPGFSGNITLEITNVSRIPIKLYAGMRIAQIVFEVLSSPALNPYGSPGLNSKYQGQNEATASKVWKDFQIAQKTSNNTHL